MRNIKTKDILEITGVFNAFTLNKIEQELNEYLDKAENLIHIDINKVSDIDISAMFMLYSLKEKAKSKGKILFINSKECAAIKKLRNYKISRLL